MIDFARYSSPELTFNAHQTTWERKCWGWTRPVFISPKCLVFELHTLPGWQCSWHYHEHRSNRFVVISGLIGIRVQKSEFDPQPTSQYLLKPGDVMDIHPPRFHLFQSFKPSVLMEIYFARDGGDISQTDIVRDQSNLGRPIENL